MYACVHISVAALALVLALAFGTQHCGLQALRGQHRKDPVSRVSSHSIWTLFGDMASTLSRRLPHRTFQYAEKRCHCHPHPPHLPAALHVECGFGASRFQPQAQPLIYFTILVSYMIILIIIIIPIMLIIIYTFNVINYCKRQYSTNTAPPPRQAPLRSRGGSPSPCS